MAWSETTSQLRLAPKTWFVSGVAGFIGSNLLQALLELGQTVIGLDNFSTGFRANLDDVSRVVGKEAFSRFEFVEGDILHQNLLEGICKECDYVLHQAALGSVPRSIENPWATHQANVDGFVSVALAAKNAGVKRIVYASSSSVYGDSADLPKREEKVGRPLSPYAASKAIDEVYADVFSRVYGLSFVGLRYFNVFGPRQNPNGPYAAVIPRWIEARLEGRECIIFGDGETSRDFCYVENVVQANILAAIATIPSSHEVFNVAVNDQTSLNALYERIESLVHSPAQRKSARYEPFRKGDVRHSRADISKAGQLLGYAPQVRVNEGLERVVAWYKQRDS